ncbi:hypothetical protein BDD12DRAFT_738452 [Trichophaea hybrida]|nr:hypothetical protein BDD12DRAFT_738452 [Trichophaea hybrida]
MPLSHPTSPSEPSYVPDPGGRGTLNILLSSIITLTLCVSTSLHLNITPQRKYFGIIQRVWIYKFYWVLIALVAPELVLYAAYIQFRNAQELCKQLKKLDNCDVTMVSAFFIVMGGFAYDVSHQFTDIPYLALTPKGFLDLAKAQLIKPDILRNNEIADRSKADSLAKFLVCIQAIWMVVNCIARKVNGLPTTLVELNVVVHVAVAVVVYGLWWHKPLAVAHPIILPSHSSFGTNPSGEETEVAPGDSRGLERDPPNYTVQGSIYTGGVQSHDRDVDIFENSILVFFCTLLSWVYAGCHATAWFSHFPSYIEQWIWRGCCIWIAAGFPISWFFFGVLSPLYYSNKDNVLEKIGRAGGYSIPILLMGLYALARLFIVVEAFISVRSLPIGSFETVNWVGYWPHI